MIARKRIVAVDDSNVVLKTLKNVLDNEGFELRAFSTGTRALEYLTQKDEIPDLIILDIEMPIMNGYDILEQIKKLDHLNNVPVVFLTSNNEKEQVVKAVTGGIKDYVIKPIDREILLKKLYALLKDQLVDGTEGSTADSTESGTADSTESGTSDSTESSTADSTEGGTADSTESGTADSTEGGTADSTEGGTADSAEAGTQDNEHDGTQGTV